MRAKKKKLKKEALRHMLELYNLAKEEFPSDLSKKYIKHIRNYSTKYNVFIPQDIKRSFCKNCNTILKPGKTCSVRLKPGKAPLKIITCKECGQIKRIGYTK